MWNLATLFGAAGAQRLGDPLSLSLDAAVPAALLPCWRHGARRRDTASAGFAGALIAAAAVPWNAAGRA